VKNVTTSETISQSTEDSERLLRAKAELVEALHQKAILEAKDNFYVFVKLLANLMLDGNTYRDGRHIEAIAATLEEIEDNSLDRLMLMLPPGSMKSVLLMMFVAWCMGRHPTWRVIWISHTADKAQDCSRRIRDFMETPEYLEVFPALRLRDDVRGVTEWKLTTGGAFLPKGAGQSLAGYRFNLGILDDPLSEQTAKSDIEREKINNWYYPGFRSRKLPDSKVILVNTRWHVRDLSGYLLDKAARNARVDQWEVISIPAILDGPAAEYLMLEEGTSYWPEYITMEDLIRTREGSSRSDWAALYLQSPTAEEGNIFEKDDFQDWDEDEPPVCDEIIQTLDTAFSTKSTADYSVIQTWGIFHLTLTDDKGREYQEPNAVLLNMERGRWSYPELRRRAAEEYKFFRPDRIIVEAKASGQSLIQDMRANKLPVFPFQPDRDKVARAHAVTGIIERGRVWLPLKKKYAAELLQEALEFPKAPHDDAVDAMVMALLYLRKRYELTQETVTQNDENQRHRPVRSYWSKAVRAA
jgi:predicted phage terminase large subunit-like protein